MISATYQRRSADWKILSPLRIPFRHSGRWDGEDTARRGRAVKIGDIAAGRGGLKKSKPSGPLAGLVEEWLKVRRTITSDRRGKETQACASITPAGMGLRNPRRRGSC